MIDLTGFVDRAIAYVSPAIAAHPNHFRPA
jgi:hypothetical protein